MADDVPTISTSRLPASEVARRSFGTARRGFDPEEVRAYLELVARELLAAERREQELLHELADAEERARHPVIDEGLLTSSLGQRSAAVLRSAHDEAAVITQRAEEAAATLVHEAHQQATEIAVRAESAGAERIAEAELAANALRQQARDEAAAVLEAARAEGETLVERAREHGRAMVEQAQEARRRVLADLGQRRRAVTDQIEQFRAARDEVAASVLGVRQSLDNIVDDLGRADDAARAAAAEAARHQEVVGSEAAFVAEAERAAAEIGLDAGSSMGTSSLDPPTGERPAFEPAHNVAAEQRAGTGVGLDEQSFRETAATPGEPSGAGRVPPAQPASPPSAAGSDVAGSWRRGDVTMRFDDLSSADDPLRALEIPTATEEVRSGADVLEDAPHPADVEGLFARLRARQEDAVTTLEQPVVPREPMAPSQSEPAGGPPAAHTGPAAARVSSGADAPADTATPPGGTETIEPGAVDEGVTGSSGETPGETASGAEEASETAEASETEDISPDRAALDRRAEVLDPIVTTMARRLKRVLQDDQNRLLDRLRKGTGEWSEDLLADEEVQRASFAKAASGSVRDAVAAGIAFSRAASRTRQGRAPTPDPQTVEAVTDELAGTVVTLLRRRLEGTDMPDAAERIGAAYREWRGERIERLALDRAVEAFSAGVLAGVGKGVNLRWVRSDAGPGCADCEDNALAGLVEPGEEFPTGHRYPPAHAGCSCLVLPTPA